MIYGCGGEAKYIFKSGKKCCSKSVNSCLGKREKDSLSKKGKIPNWKNGAPKGFTGKTPWNKNLTKEIDIRCEISEETKVKISKNTTGRASTKERELIRIEKIKNAAETNKKMGGKRHGSGRGKKGRYKGYWCDSSWELAFVIYNIEHNIKFRRNKEWFEYFFLGEKHKFYPDFIMENGIFVEIKGYFSRQYEAKIKNFCGSLKTIDKNGIKPYLEYVISKYGKNFIELYGE